MAFSKVLRGQDSDDSQRARSGMLAAMAEVLGWDDVPAFLCEIRQMARRLLSLERRSGSLRTTALVATALRRQRLTDQTFAEVTWRDREHLLAALYTAMRRDLIDHARQRSCRREKLLQPEELELEEIPERLQELPEQAEALAHALEVMAARHPRWAALVQHRYFAGLTLDEIAQVMNVPERTLRRWWQCARVLLADEILGFLAKPREDSTT